MDRRWMDVWMNGWIGYLYSQIYYIFIYPFIQYTHTHIYIYLCMYVCLSAHYIIYTSLYIYVCVRKWFLDKFARFRREMVWIHTQLGTDTAEICCNSDIIYIYNNRLALRILTYSSLRVQRLFLKARLDF